MDDKALKIKLQNCNTINQVIKVCDEHYNLDQPLGVMSKAAVITGVFQAIRVTQTKKR